jgi:hypothetical protein
MSQVIEGITIAQLSKVIRPSWSFVDLQVRLLVSHLTSKPELVNGIEESSKGPMVRTGRRQRKSQEDA